jgi:predicted ATPase
MTRLLTLTGVGGTGKTRLALEVARDLVDAYPDGVWQVELAPLSGSEQVPQAVARGLQPLSSLSSRSPSGLRLLTLFNRNFGGY